MTVASDTPSSPRSTPRTLEIEIYSDVVCPWCYIGKRRIEAALADVSDEFAAQQISVDVRYLPYQLDPKAPIGSPIPVSEAYAKKFGGPERAAAILANVTEVAASVGLEFRMDRALRANTMRAHRLLWQADGNDLGYTQGELKERLLKAYFHDGLDIGDPVVLASCVEDIGGVARDAFDFLTSDAGVDEVIELMNGALERDVTAVPTYLVGGGWAIPGAQEPETFSMILRKMAAKLD